jgi:two-component system cell cycle response regulator
LKGRAVNPGSVTRKVAAHREFYMGDYEEDDLLMPMSQDESWLPLRAALIVPMAHQGEILGTINLYRPMPNSFGQHDRQLLQAIAERAAAAVSHGQLLDRARGQSLTDPLTGLYNLHWVMRHLTERCRQAEHSSDTFAVLCLDLASFKPLNDSFGPQKGDQVLRALSRLFREMAASTDVVARYGGDKFLIILSGARPDSAAVMAQRLRRAVEEYDLALVHTRLGALHLGVSIGIACFPANGHSAADLLVLAEQQLSREKTERKLGLLADPVLTSPKTDDYPSKTDAASASCTELALPLLL